MAGVITKVDMRESWMSYGGVTAAAQNYWAAVGGSIVVGEGAFGQDAFAPGGGGSFLQYNMVARRERSVSEYIFCPSAQAWNTTINVSGGHDVVGVYGGPDGAVSLLNGIGLGTVLDATDAATFQFGVQNHLEMYTYVHDVDGLAVVWLNNVEILRATGNTTGSEGTGYFGTQLRMNASGSGRFSHNWMAQVSGGEIHVGPRRVLFLRANDGGDVTGFTPVGDLVDNYKNIDETPPDDVDYNYANVPGTRDGYQYESSPPGTTDIIDLARCSRAYVDDATAHLLRQNFKSSGVTLNLDTWTLPGTPGIRKEGSLVDPATSAAWIKTGVDAVQGEIEIIS
jgi:hypothetical protein